VSKALTTVTRLMARLRATARRATYPNTPASTGRRNSAPPTRSDRPEARWGTVEQRGHRRAINLRLGRHLAILRYSPECVEVEFSVVRIQHSAWIAWQDRLRIPLPRSYTSNSTLYVLALHDYPSWEGFHRGGNLSSELRLVDPADPLAPATSQLQKNRRRAIHVLSTPLDPTLTLTRTQYPAIVGNVGNRKPVV
jgi:hypothetical protein